MSIKIITDSTAQLTAEEISKYNIHVVPLNIQIGDESYLDGETMQRDEFASRLQTAIQENQDLPTTSQPSNGRLVDYYDRLGQDGSQIISIHLTSLLSGTVEGAFTAAHQSQSDVEIIDSHAIDRGLAYQVIQAAKLAQAGADLETIKQCLLEIKAQTKTYVYLDSLDALQRGGRISKMTGLLTRLIKLKLILELTETELKVVGKGRSSKTLLKFAQHLSTELSPQTVRDISISHVNSSNATIEEVFNTINIDKTNVTHYFNLTSPAVMSHVGLNAIGIFILTDN